MSRWMAALALPLLFLSAADALGASVVDLSHHRVDIDVGFQGEDILVFGALSENQDVIVRVLGPQRRLRARRYEQRDGLWFLESGGWILPAVPSFYHLASSRPLAGIAEEGLLERYGLGASRFLIQGSADDGRGLRESLGKSGLWSDHRAKVEVQEGRLFQTRFHLPFKASTGRYRVDAFTFAQGRLMSRSHTFLDVRRVGLGRTLHRLSREHGFLYGILAVLMAVGMGGAAALAMRRYR